MHCYSTILALAGIRGGTVYGSSDKQAAWPVDGPVRPADVCATIFDRPGNRILTCPLPSAEPSAQNRPGGRADPRPPGVHALESSRLRSTVSVPGEDRSMKIWLGRHGEAKSSRIRRATDVELALSDVGRRQVVQLVCWCRACEEIRA